MKYFTYLCFFLALFTNPIFSEEQVPEKKICEEFVEMYKKVYGKKLDAFDCPEDYWINKNIKIWRIQKSKNKSTIAFNFVVIPQTEGDSPKDLETKIWQQYLQSKDIEKVSSKNTKLKKLNKCITCSRKKNEHLLHCTAEIPIYKLEAMGIEITK